jgi:hypothetical protein
MTSFLFLGVIAIALLLILFKKNPALEGSAANRMMVNLLSHASWFQSHWKAGLFLFISNALLLSATLLILYSLLFINIPYIHLVIMFLATAFSIRLWLNMKLAWKGAEKGRLKVGLIGSSFYLFLFIFFFYQFAAAESEFPGDDPFMPAIGFLFGMIVAATAGISCLSVISISSQAK